MRYRPTASETAGATGSARRERWLSWLDGPLLTLCPGSLAVVIAGGLVQVSHGAYSMTVADAWRAVFIQAVTRNELASPFILGVSSYGQL